MKSLSKVLDLYRPYLPAALTFVGALLIAVGLFFGQWKHASHVFQWFRLFGASVAAIGAFWSAHRQVQSAAANKERDQKIIDLSEQLHGHLTGGNSFCYGLPLNVDTRSFKWIFTHSGRYPLSDVNVRICNLANAANPFALLGRSVQIGTMFPGKAWDSGVLEAKHISQGFNLFFVARNGGWLQEIRWTELPDRLAMANRVTRDGVGLDKPLLLDISPDFPGRTPADQAWNDPPPYWRR